MRKSNYFAYIVALLFVVGMAQYAPVVIDSIVRGNVQMWTLDSSALDGAGPTRYLKDLFVFGFGASWPIAMIRRRRSAEIAAICSFYFLWIMAVVSLGLIGFIAELSPVLFLLAGVRWVMLLHCSFGLFLMAKGFPESPIVQRRLILLLLAFGILNVYVANKQASLGVALSSVALVQSRVTGLFSNAGIAGMFGLALAIFSVMLDRALAWQRIGLVAAAFVTALLSGTRFAVLSITLLVGVLGWELIVHHAEKHRKMLLTVMTIPLALSAAVVGYVSLMAAAGRGDIVGTQLEKGGRIANAVSTLTDLGSADLGELFFGRGLGIGTNTAIGYLQANGIDPNQFRFNWQIDNGFITLTFQIGVIGLLLFVTGMFAFLRKVKPQRSRRLRIRYWAMLIILIITFSGGNILEHYFLLTSFFIGFGTIFWQDFRETTTAPQMTASSIDFDQRGENVMSR
ncbi:hypothetical protein F4827_000552 [Paraburkholderia bannensis]|uniref:O-antigen ligase domain-containing protein n=1 Tax=Paraburkholderia bannensis TaxID=765414 RepID=A0A7W9TSP2_9BURK|nr:MULTISPECIES: hypothetical protein [Paraburkholderia]MBB3255240.1 hypothetical protein [Paraburkholderia sp. WP4_3_2]MBB6100748.1 hypothetical protein [Paraburkholderia bannensis]